jgi:phosphodiesterase/alkaline phosphatase D-like protein
VAQLSESEVFTNPVSLPAVQSTEASDFTVKVEAKGLKPGTKYFYRFTAGSDTSPIGSFKTAYAPDQNAKVTMAFSGDADWKWKPYPILNQLIKEPLDYFFFLGDLLYETTDLAGKTSVEDLNGYRFKYRQNREPRPDSTSNMVPMLDLYRLFGQYSVFDNHETGLSKSDKNAPSYNEGGAQVGGQFVNQSVGFKARIQAYREYQPVVDELVAGTDDSRTDQTYKFYRTILWGANVELVILDDRSYRDSRLINSDDPQAASCSRTMLGASQLKWFENELLSAKQRKVTWKVVAISSPIQVLGRNSQIGSDQDGTKSWSGGYMCERNELLKFIDDNAIDNVVFLTTDNHYTVINNLKYNSVPADPKSPLKAARNAFEILTGPLGASAGTPNINVDIKGLAIREADRKILATWNGDVANSNGKLQGLKQAGLDPIGLEADFPGLDVGSIKATDGTPGVVEPLDFASFNTYGYAVLTFDQSSLSVQVKGLPLLPDPAVLLTPTVEQEYESHQAEPILSFVVHAQ